MEVGYLHAWAIVCQHGSPMFGNYFEDSVKYKDYTLSSITKIYSKRERSLIHQEKSESIVQAHTMWNSVKFSVFPIIVQKNTWFHCFIITDKQYCIKKYKIGTTYNYDISIKDNLHNLLCLFLQTLYAVCMCACSCQPLLYAASEHRLIRMPIAVLHSWEHIHSQVSTSMQCLQPKRIPTVPLFKWERQRST